MGLFDFIKSRTTFESQVNKLEGIIITDKPNSKVIEIKQEITIETIKQLLIILRLKKTAFSLFDNLYPSPSDPGAYITYSQKQNEYDNTWSMTLGNHGWTGGIYTIEEKNIALQLFNLSKQKIKISIKISGVEIFKYDKVNVENNRNQNALIYGLHSNLKQINPNYLIFGLFSSEGWGPYNIYRLTQTELFVDKSETWHSHRHTYSGYNFEAEILPKEMFETAKELLNNIPAEFLTKKWKEFYTTGNKNEDKLILEFENSDFHKSITIDSYEIETNRLPKEIKNYRLTIENVIRKLNEQNNNSH